MTTKHRTMICWNIHNNDGNWAGNINGLYIVGGANPTTTQAVKINAGADVIQNAWAAASANLFSTGDEGQAFDYIQTAMGGSVGIITPNWKISLYSVAEGDDGGSNAPGTGTVTYVYDDVRYDSLGSSALLADIAIRAAIVTMRSTNHKTHIYLCSSFDDDLTLTSGESTWANAKFVYRWCDATDTLQLDLGNGNFYTVGTGLTTFQSALDLLAAIYPTKAYDAAYSTDGDGCQTIIVQVDSEGTPGTITPSQGFQDLIEDNGTWIAPMRMGVDFRKWV